MEAATPDLYHVTDVDDSAVSDLATPIGKQDRHGLYTYTIPLPLRTLILACWSQSPSQRPSLKSKSHTKSVIIIDCHFNFLLILLVSTRTTCTNFIRIVLFLLFILLLL